MAPIHDPRCASQVAPEAVGTANSRFWPTIAVATVLAIVIAAVHFSLDHPYGIHWDESLYLNEAAIDVQHLRNLQLIKLMGSLLKSGLRPPGYRILALPVTAVFGFHVTLLRLVTLACYCLSSSLIYSVVRRMESRSVGVLAVLVFGLCTEIIVSSTYFSTEGPLLLATAALFYYLISYWSGKESLHSSIGVGVAIGLGLLSKASFALVAFPVLLFCFFNNPSRRRTLFLARACCIAIVIAGPWWLLNFNQALGYANYARNQYRSSLGTSSLATVARWLGSVCLGLLGPAISILSILIAATSLYKIVVAKKVTLNGTSKTVLIACFCAILPLTVVHMLGTNHLLRYLAPGLVPLAISAGVLAARSGWLRSTAAIAVSGLLLSTQLGMILAPVLRPNRVAIDPGLVTGAVPWRVLVRFDQWNWGAVRDITQPCNLSNPKIAYLGNSRAFNPPQIQYPWIAAGEPAPEVTWLWRYEDGTPNWANIAALINDIDIVLTVPHYTGQITDRQDLDNQHNAEFVDRLSQDARLRGPIRLRMGRFEPVELDLFLKATLSCYPRLALAQFWPGS